MSNVVRLDPSDNVVTAIKPLELGVDIEGHATTGLIPRGHKIATASMAVGDPIRKYAQIIGYAAERRAIQLKLDTQESLLDLGYAIGEIDGVIGRGTRKAIRSFQKSHGLAANGKPSQDLLAALTKAGRERGVLRPDVAAPD